MAMVDDNMGTVGGRVFLQWAGVRRTRQKPTQDKRTPPPKDLQTSVKFILHCFFVYSLQQTDADTYKSTSASVTVLRIVGGV